MSNLCYKISVCIPEKYLNALMDSVAGAAKPLYPGYRRCFSYWPAKGTWIPETGTSPFSGVPGEICTEDEMKVEFAVKEEDLVSAVKAVRDVHPYEEPAIDVVPMLKWKDVIASDGTNRCCRRFSAFCGCGGSACGIPVHRGTLFRFRRNRPEEPWPRRRRTRPPPVCQ